MKKTTKKNAQLKRQNGHLKLQGITSEVELTNNEIFIDSGTETVNNSGRITPTPSDIFSDEGFTEKLADESKIVKKLIKIRKTGRFYKNLTEVEHFTGSEDDSIPNYDRSRTSPDFDLRKLLLDSSVTSHDGFKKSSSSSEEDLSMSVKSCRKPLEGCSGISDLELTSECEEEINSKMSPRQSKRAFAIIYDGNTDIEQLSADETKLEKPSAVKLRQPSPISQLLEAMTSAGVSTITPGDFNQTEEENFTDESESYDNLSDSERKILTPMKNYESDYGVISQKHQEVDLEKPKKQLRKSVPKIVISQVESDALELVIRSDSSLGRNSPGLTEVEELENIFNREKVRKQQRKKNQKIVRQNSLSDSEEMLKPEAKEKRTRKGKRQNSKKLIKMVATDVEELELSDREPIIVESNDSDTDCESFTSGSVSSEEDPRKAEIPQTDLEEFLEWSEEEETYSTISASPAFDEGSTVHIQNRIQSDYNAPEELMHLKQFVELPEVHTDVENMEFSEKRIKSKKCVREVFERFKGETVRYVSKSRFCTFVQAGGYSVTGIDKKISGNARKQKKSSTKRATKDWSEKGQSEEYAYENKGIEGQVPQPTDEDRQPAGKLKSDREAEDKSGGVKFYELNEEEVSIPNEDDPVPEVTMPSYKKRVHSQRIPQRERPAVTPYEGAYDEKYSSDEDNIEYEVYEPDDLTERSNSTVTFSEDVYDSDTMDEMIKAQIRKPSQLSQDGSVRSEESQLLPEGAKPSKSILKEGKEKKESKKKGMLTSAFAEPLSDPQGMRVSPVELAKTWEETFTKEAEKISQVVTSTKDQKTEKGEKIFEDVTKPEQDAVTHKIKEKTPKIKGEKGVSKSLESSISQQIDQITDSAATNKIDFAKQDDEMLKSVTKPLQDPEKQNVDILSKNLTSVKALDQTSVKVQPTEQDLTSKLESHKDENSSTNTLIQKSAPSTLIQQIIIDPKADLAKTSIQSPEKNQTVNGFLKLVKDKKPEIPNVEPESPNTILESGIYEHGEKSLESITKPLTSKSKEVVEKPSKSIGEEKVSEAAEVSETNFTTFAGIEQKPESKEEISKSLSLKDISPVTKEDARKTAKELLEDITKSLQSVFPGKLDSTSTTLENENKSSNDILEGEVLLKKDDKMEAATSSSTYSIADIENKAFDKYVDSEKITDENVQKVVEDAKRLTEELTTTALETVFSIKDEDEIKSKEAIKLDSQLISEEICTELGKIRSTTIPTKDDVKVERDQKISSVTQDLTDAMKPVANGMLKTLKTAIDAKDKTEGEVKMLEEVVTDKVVGVVGAISGETDDKKDKVLKNEGEFLTEAVTDKVTSSFGATTEKPVEIFKKLMLENISKGSESISKAVESAESEVSEIIKEAQSKVSEMTGVVASAKSTVIDKTEKISNGVIKQTDKLQEVVIVGKENIQSTDLGTSLSKILQKISSTETEVEIPSREIIENAEKMPKESDKLKEGNVLEEITTKTSQSGSAQMTIAEVNKMIEIVKPQTDAIVPGMSLHLPEPDQSALSSLTVETSKAEKVISKEVPKPLIEITKDLQDTSDNLSDKDPDESPDGDSKPRVIFRIESEDELLSDTENEVFPSSDISSSTEDFAEKVKKELKLSLEKEQLILEEKLSSLKSGIFDISDESLSKTKELVDERLRKISEIKPPKELEEKQRKISDVKPPKEREEPGKKEKSKRTFSGEVIKIGRFHVTPALMEEVVNRTREKEIAERLKTNRRTEDVIEEMEKELPAKLTEADLEEVIRELKLEGLNTDVYFQPEEKEKEEKKKLKRVERRFERMASETMEMEKEEADSVSEEKLDEKREVEFQRMVSNLSTEEVAEYQQEYLQLWDDGGLSSLTPTDDWESKDPDTPENELEDDSAKKPESFRGSHGIGKNGEPNKTETKPFKSPVSPPKPWPSEDISPSAQPLTPIDPSRVGSSPSEIDQTSGFVSERSEDIPTYDERKKFWEQMSSSQGSETTSEIPRSMHESVSSAESFDIDRRSKDLESVVKTTKQKFEKEITETQEIIEEGSLVKTLTESYSKKIAAGELVMPATPRPKSEVYKPTLESNLEPTQIIRDSPGTEIVSELETKLKTISPSAPITEDTVIIGSTKPEPSENVEFTIGSTVITKTKAERTMSTEKSSDSEAEFLAKYGVESVAFDNIIFSEEDEGEYPLAESKMAFGESFDKRPPPVVPIRKSIYDRSRSLPAEEITESMKEKKKQFEEQMKKEIVVEQIMVQERENVEKLSEMKPITKTKIKELDEKDFKTEFIMEETTKLISNVRTGEYILDKIPKTLGLKETHVEKSEIEENEKVLEPEKPKRREEELPSITVTSSAKRHTETGSMGESEDTQSESDVTPEDARVVDNGDTHWDGSGTHSSGVSPKDDMDYAKEPTETGIGRWIGQEDLSQQNWEKDDLDSSHFKIHTRWERTRSEGTSPKDHYVYTPEEHYPDTVWEVPVQEQLEKEEITHDIPIEKQVIIEKDEEEEDESEKPKLTEEEAKEIAEEIMEYIQFEVENRASFLENDDEEEVPQGMTPSQVTDYIRHLADNKNLDEQEVQLIESVLLKKQRDQFRKSQTDTVSSMEITDEELRSSGIDEDLRPLETQITKLQHLEEITIPDEMTEPDTQNLKDVEIVDQTLAEVKESLEAAQEELIEQHKKRKKNEMFKKESPSEFEFKDMSYERSITETIKEQTSDWVKVSEFESAKDGESTKSMMKNEGKERILEEEEAQLEISKTEKITDQEKIKEKVKDSTESKLKAKDSHEINLEKEISQTQTTEKILRKDTLEEEKQFTKNHEALSILETEDKVQTEEKKKDETEEEKISKKDERLEEKKETESTKIQRTDFQTQNQVIQKQKEKEVLSKSVEDKKGEKKSTEMIEEKGVSTDSLAESEETMSKIVEKDTVRQSSAVSSKSVETSIRDSSKTYTSFEIKSEDEKKSESFLTKKMSEQRYSSEESTKSTSLEEFIKSPPNEMLSSTSSAEKHGEIKSEKSDIVFRHSSSSSINALLKADRRSGTDMEPYSSSGESHYQSFEQTSSRPCSSDVEMLMVGNVATTGSSEYESALSQETSSKQVTSTDYHTAVSSLSSRESIKSLDSESSGHLASVEVSSEASETLIPSALELEKDLETPGTILLDDDALDVGRGKAKRLPMYTTQVLAPSETAKPTTDEDFEIIEESEIVSWAGEVSEDDEGALAAAEEVVADDENLPKIKRSHEMTFQPEPKPIVFSDGLERRSSTEKVMFGSIGDETSSIISVPDERYGSSLEESGSVLSMSLSTASETSALRTVIELSRTDSEKMDVSGTSLDSVSREELETSAPQILTNEMSTSTLIHSMDKKTSSVTITTSTSDEQGIPSVSTQVTSVSRKSSMVDENKSESESITSSSKPIETSHANGPTQVDYVPDYDDVETTKTRKPQGHRREKSTSNFVPTMMWSLTEATVQKVKADITEIEEEQETDKYVYDATLTEKEVKNDEKKESDDLENYDHNFEHYAQERKISEGEELEEFKDYDINRPNSQISRTDSESGRRPVSSVFSDDRPDSELSELMKQGSSETEKEDPMERPLTPEPEEMENKDITPEFSSEAQASVTELEMEYSGAYSRRDEYASHVSPIREEKTEIYFKDKSPDEPTNEYGIADGLQSQTSLESTIAEKHELETGEKEILRKKSIDVSGTNVPDITITEHMTPVLNEKFQYPDTKEDLKDKKSADKTPDTPASTSSRTSSISTDQGREYNLDDVEIKKFPKETLNEEKEVNETKDEKESLDSPSSDSFEMLDKPDPMDEFVIIEEVGREAQENDQEGKSIQITSKRKKVAKKQNEDEEEIILSPSSPATKMTDLKYFPSEDPDMFPIESDSPPQPTTRKFVEKIKRKSSKEEKDDLEFEQQIEQNKKWVEMQFQGEQAAKIVGGYGYEMEFERVPLEDIKEEDLNELDSSSKIGSMGSQKESIGSFGSVKDSFSSTPDYDVLAGKKYFTRSGEQDDVSMSSLQEFELIEKKLMENSKKSGSSSSQDSLSSKKLGTSSKSGEGDDISRASLREFENLENACATVVKMETKAKQEEAILSEIDEGHESQISESESCETVSAVMREKIESDTEDFDKRMFEIDEIIKQAQSNVEKFSEMQALEKIESMGRGDSYEEVAKVPDLELDMPFSSKSINPKTEKGSSKMYSTQVVTKKKFQQWRASEGLDMPKVESKSSSSLEPAAKTKLEPGKHSELLENGGKIKSISADSLEIQDKEKQLMVEGKDDTISLDSYKRKSQKSDVYGFSEIAYKSDSMEEVSASLRHHETSSGEYSSSGREDSDHPHRPPPRADFMLGSTDSLDPSSSTATHATYQYETDSVMSSSFTSGGSNTMVSSTDNLDLLISNQSVIDLSKDLGLSRTDDWLENLQVGMEPLKRKVFDEKSPIQQKVTPDIQKSALKEQGPEKGLHPGEDIETEVDEYVNVHTKKILHQKLKMDSKKSIENQEEHTTFHLEKLDIGYKDPFVSETVEPLTHGEYSHIIHKRTQMVPEVERVVFKGPDAKKALEEYTKQLNGEEVEEIKETDEHGNIIIKKVIRQRVLMKTEESQQAPQAVAQDLKMQTGVQKISFTGTGAEKALEDYMKNIKTEDEIIETEETDEYGNVHLRKVLKQKYVVKPEITEQIFQEGMEIPSGIQKITFKGPDAEKQLQEFMESQQPEIEEIEEVDEDGNVHIKRIVRQRIFVQPSDLQKAKSKDSKNGKTLQDYLEDVKENENFIEMKDVDERGTVKTVKIPRQKMDSRSGKILSQQELDEYLEQLEEPEWRESEPPTQYIRQTSELPSEFQKVTFKGPDAEKKLREFMEEQQQPEVEEIEEVDEHGNVHVKRIMKQKIFVRPSQAQKISVETGKSLQDYLEELVEVEKIDEHGNINIVKVPRRQTSQKSGKMLSQTELNQYLDKLEEAEWRETSSSTQCIRRTTELPSEFQKVTFKGPDECSKASTQQIRTVTGQEEFIDMEGIDEYGNVKIFEIPEQHYFKPLTKDKSDQDLGETEKVEREQKEQSQDLDRKIMMSNEFQKVTFRGPEAEKQLEEFVKQQQPEEVEEIEEVDEHGNVHIKKILKQKIIVTSSEMDKASSKNGKTLQDYLDAARGKKEFIELEEIDEHGDVKIIRVPRQKFDESKSLTKEELQKYLDQLKEPEWRETEEQSTQYLHRTEMPSEVQKITFKGPYAEKQLQEYLKKQQPEEVEEIEEVDEHGNVHVKRIMKQKIFVRPSQAQKISVETGKTLQDYLEELVEVEKIDEHGNINIVKVPRRQTSQKSGKMLSQTELNQYLDQLEEPEWRETEPATQYICKTTELPSEFQKVIFKGPDAEKKLREFMEQQQPEIEEIEKVDEDGNVHIKRIVRQRMFVRPEDFASSSKTDVTEVAFQGSDSEKILQSYIENLGPDEEVVEMEEEDEHGNIHLKKVLRQRVVIRPEDLGNRDLTKEELQDYLKQISNKTTLHIEKVDLGSTEPFVTEIIEPLDESEFSHIIHRKVQMVPEVQRVTFRGPDADEALDTYMKALDPGEDIEETEEVDEDGNVHVKRILRRKIILKPEDLEKTGLTGEELKSYLKQLENQTFGGDSTSHLTSFDPSTNQTLTEALSSSIKLTEKDERSKEGRDDSVPSSATRKEGGIFQRPPLLSDISMDDEAEYDTTEHDWRHQLEILNAEADEEEIDENLDAALGATSDMKKK